MSEDRAQRLVRPSADDMFRLGSREARQSVVADSAPMASGTDSDSDAVVDEAVVRHAADGVSMPGVELDVRDGGRLVLVTGDRLAAGVVVGRLLAALAAAGLRGRWPVDPPGGATTALAVVTPARGVSS